jgi:hypothetical protein
LEPSTATQAMDLRQLEHSGRCASACSSTGLTSPILGEINVYASPSCVSFPPLTLTLSRLPARPPPLRSRHLLEVHKPGEKPFGTVHHYLESRRLKLATGIIVDAPIINAPYSTRNLEGNEWYFGVKAYVDVLCKA